MNYLFSMFIVQTLLWIVLLFFLLRLIKTNSRLKEEVDLLTEKLGIKNKEE
ncbi:MAG: hypothetical protein GWO07_09255 [Candidatus Dadabacteria bacterium]|nr:hypothetical protein [Candidatus Dadabacteria bacterium]NIS08934.1 hypothetical protein [Candidatus Dadabacteria bacterium]NIV40836.1 hypothetical protein [Candidatus Dadabacteria bacterium]NIX15484.1 hypothetical protein [Candidatus Dadabacteria bacterium]NIY22805.1 hypothetical protein [Candidatus Dadabacteria bacterium]